MSKYFRYAFSVDPTSRGAGSLGDQIELVHAPGQNPVPARPCR